MTQTGPASKMARMYMASDLWAADHRTNSPEALAVAGLGGRSGRSSVAGREAPAA
jgi:hypothetical protein